jgi:L-aminopeptidase/D-esterase-like protein
VKAMSELEDRMHDDICDVPGILVGHETLLEAGTGCTVVRCAWPTLGSVEVRGGAPATRETDLLDPLCMMREVHAVVLAGGSAFGLDAASGVMRALEAEGIGFDVGVARVPIVPAAALFDLGIGRSDIRPDAAAGERALQAATSNPVAQGTVGVGTGAVIGRLGGRELATKGGIGSASTRLPDGHLLGALVAVNALGDVYDSAIGRIVAGARSPSGRGWQADETAGGAAQELPTRDLFPGAQTTLAVIATDAPFTKVELAKLAQMAHDGLALAVRPVHTPFDGDLVFALSTAHGSPTAPAASPESEAPFPARGATLALALAGAEAARTLARAIVKAVRAATSLHNVPACRDLPF